jgi:hypothetical protein
MLPMTNIAMPTTSCHDISGAMQHASGSATHFRQHSISDSAPGSNATQLMFADPVQTSSTVGASWSMAPQVPDVGSGHCRKGSQESVDFPGSLASDSFCSTTFAGVLSCRRVLVPHCSIYGLAG